MGELTPVKIRIKNFQSLKDVEIEVHGFTCITGPTNIGKSAVIRAISGSLLNSPVTGMVRKGEKNCTVTIEAEGWGYTWEKGERGINRYWMPGADKPLDKVGAGQIDEVVDMGFPSVRVGSRTVQPWFAHQFEQLFLMRESGPAITDFISEVSRLKVLQDAVIINARGKRRATDKAKLHLESVEALREKEEAVSQLDSLLRVEEDLDAQLSSLQEWEERRRRGQELVDSMDRTAECIRFLLPYKEVSWPADRMGKRVERLGVMHSIFQKMEEAALLVHALRSVEEIPTPPGPEADEMAALGRLERFSAIPELSDGTEALRGVEGLGRPREPDGEAVARLATGSRLAEALRAAEGTVEALSAELGDAPPAPEWDGSMTRGAALAEEMDVIHGQEATMTEELGVLTEELAAVEEELSSIPVCPTCERPVDPGKHSHVVSVSA